MNCVVTKTHFWISLCVPPCVGSWHLWVFFFWPCHHY